MSASRTDTLTTIASGIRKFEGFTAAQLLAWQWAGLAGLHLHDIAFFRQNADKPAKAVAIACLDRGHANPAPLV